VITHETVLEALADGTRRRIIERLARGPASVADLAAGLPVSRPAVSQHLRVLLHAGLVGYHEQGTKNIYRLERAGFDLLRSWLDRFWGDVLDRFEAYANQQEGT
jgi:DNA-binding transcriptional ArsR family regulator